MFNKIITALCIITFSTAVYSEDCEPNCKRYCCRGQSSAYGSNYSIGTSMVTWGALFFVGFGLITALIDSDVAHGDSTD